ncbi:MAG TPA: SGNH/GDSL hydrolase family protein [Casimicrobiaceae bacterium]|nr:SGNH/GDSL hydrolase family protein [Casimicrobiaceae bacterium]
MLGWALAAPLSWAGGPVTELVVFGDSLSDSGNAFALQKENNTPPNYSVNPLLIPDDAYARGGHQFSNGPTWAEQFGKSLGLCQDVSPAFRDANPRATNYAVGGARARNDVSMNINLPIQVQVFLQDFGGSAPPDALYVIEIGGNDLRDALAAFGPNQDLPAALAVIAAGVSSVGNNISNLYQRGARNFLVWNGPDIGLTPAVRALGPGAVFVAGVLTQGYNGALATLLTGLGALPGIQIVEFDLYKTLNDIVADPSVSGLSDVTDACISPSNPPFVCKNPDSYLFWDGIHPTTVAHGILAQAVAKTLQ